MNRKGSLVVGVVFLILGGIFLLNNLNIFRFSANIFDIGFLLAKFWPLLFLIIPGLIFHSVFFSGRSGDAGLLVPGGILLVLGVAFQINMLFGLWNIMWPFYIMSVAVGLFELYLFGGREKGLLIPVGILGGLSVILFAGNSLRWLFDLSTRQFLVPLIFIVLGLAVILKGGAGRRNF